MIPIQIGWSSYTFMAMVASNLIAPAILIQIVCSRANVVTAINLINTAPADSFEIGKVPDRMEACFVTSNVSTFSEIYYNLLNQ